MQLNKNTGKFWSFDDTKHYKRIKKISNPQAIRNFIFTKSYLVKVKVKDLNNTDILNDYYVIPTKFQSNIWPLGVYHGVTNIGLIYFTDTNIIEVY